MQVQTNNFPQLKLLCWNRPAGTILDGQDALGLYENNWRHVDQAALQDNEKALIKLLTVMYGNGVFLS